MKSLETLEEEWIERLKQEAIVLAATDRRYHQTYGHDLNPFSTEGVRSLWQQGWDGKPAPEFDAVGSYYWQAWERGRQARILEEES